jgi:hypothetical protein
MKWGIIILIVLVCGYVTATLTDEQKQEIEEHKKILSAIHHGVAKDDAAIHLLQTSLDYMIETASSADKEMLCHHAPNVNMALRISKNFLDNSLGTWCPGGNEERFLNAIFLFDVKEAQKFCDAWTMISESMDQLSKNVDTVYEEVCLEEE